MKRLFVLFFLFYMVQTPVYATLYRYSGNMPMAKMMLDFMEVMGFIRRVSESHASGKGRYPGSAARLWGFNPALNSIPWADMTAFNAMEGNPSVPAGDQEVRMTKKEWGALVRAAQQGQQMSARRPINRAPTPAESPSRPVNSLNGIWRDSNQNVLSIFGSRFVWTDKEGGVIYGEFSVNGDSMTTRIPEKNATMTYRIQRQGSRFIAVTDAGLRYEFVRQH